MIGVGLVVGVGLMVWFAGVPRIGVERIGGVDRIDGVETVGTADGMLVTGLPVVSIATGASVGDARTPANPDLSAVGDAAGAAAGAASTAFDFPADVVLPVSAPTSVVARETSSARMVLAGDTG